MRGQLTVEASKYQLLRQRLLADYPNLDEETVADTLEGITDLHEMIAVVIRSALVDEAVQAGLRCSRGLSSEPAKSANSPLRL